MVHHLLHPLPTEESRLVFVRWCWCVDASASITVTVVVVVVVETIATTSVAVTQHSVRGREASTATGSVRRTDLTLPLLLKDSDVVQEIVQEVDVNVVF